MKILIIGASGYLGKRLYSRLNSNDENIVTGTYCHTESTIFKWCDVLNTSNLDWIVDGKFDIIIWAVMDQSNEESISETGLNYLVSNIADSTRLIYISTTIAIGKNQSEDIIPIKRSNDEYLHLYVNGKILGESIVSKHYNHVIIRPGIIYGFGENYSYDARMKFLYEKSKSDEKYARTDNLYTSFVHVDDLVSSIIELLGSNYIGKINIAGDIAVSYYKFNKHLASIMNINDNFIISESLDNPKYHTLSAEKRKKELRTVIREIKE